MQLKSMGKETLLGNTEVTKLLDGEVIKYGGKEIEVILSFFFYFFWDPLMFFKKIDPK